MLSLGRGGDGDLRKVVKYGGGKGGNQKDWQLVAADGQWRNLIGRLRASYFLKYHPLHTRG